MVICRKVVARLPDWPFIGGWARQCGDFSQKLPNIIVLSHLVDTMLG